MHIPDGFLSPEVAGATGGRRPSPPSATACGARSATLDERRVPLLGVTGAFIFAAQMLNFPVAGGTSGHFLGAALAAILLGPWLACLTMAVVLSLQAFVFADGGITALGANILNMGVIGALLVGGLMLAEPPSAAEEPGDPARDHRRRRLAGGDGGCDRDLARARHLRHRAARDGAAGDARRPRPDRRSARRSSPSPPSRPCSRPGPI